MIRHSAYRFETSPATPGQRFTVTSCVTVIPAARDLRGNDRNDLPYGGSRNG
jgi:hypothetical protein